ncbi:MAG: DegT/DnrJ/EryC1/StrS family aminotransferase [Chloroflexi bacterium]|nr:DegT/DnrJ/EryC1/StrS family aminotransferase [Chloroflexota bacterium]
MQLAIHGGMPYRTRPFPTCANASGRWLGEEEKRLLAEVIDSGALGRNDGSKVVALERAWAEMLGFGASAQPNGGAPLAAQAVTSGTAALHTAVASLNLEPGDEVVTTTITDMGTVIAILACNLVPTFADVDPRTGNITAETIAAQISPKTRAIIVVHLFGQMADMPPILALARQHGLYVIEDCAQAHLAAYNGRLAGTLGDLGCFSFQQSKQMTTGDGGLVVTCNEALATRARLFTDKGWPRGIPGLRGHLLFGMNYRMTELQGAVGLAQAGKLTEIVAQRRRTAGLLRQLMADIPGLIPPHIIPGADHSWWMFPFTIDQARLGVSPQAFGQAIKAEGLPFGVGYIPNPVFEYDVIRDRKTFGASGIPWTLPQARPGIIYDRRDYPGTLRFLDEMFVMSWNEGLTEADVHDIAGALAKVARYYRND